MPAGLSKDIVFLFGGILLSFALESERRRLDGVIGSDALTLVCLAIFALLTGGYLIFRYYHNLLGAGPGSGGSARHRAYENLRVSLSEGGSPARLYVLWLERSLHLVERLFREQPPADRSFVQHVIGLTRPAALWTAPALDWCVLFSFIFPQALLILGWGVTGQAGAAEGVLGLTPQPDTLARYVTMGAVAVAAYAYAKCFALLERRRLSHLPGSVHWSRFLLWQLVVIGATLVIDHYLGHGANAVGGSTILSSSVIGAVAGDVLVGIAAGSLGAVVGMSIMAFHLGAFAGCMAAAFACALAGYGRAAWGGPGSAWQRLRLRLHRSQLFWWLFLLLAAAFYLALARYLPRSQAFPVLGAILLYYGLLPALNAPFLWFSVGLTRAFLWLGLEKKGWWPYLFALVDAAVAVLVMVLLVAVMVVGIQALNLMAMRGGEEEIFPLAPLLNVVRFGPAGNHFRADDWWAYTLLFLALVPSLMNLAVGGFSLLRGIPVLSRHLHALLPEDHGVEHHDRNRIALILALQAMTGTGLAVIWQFVLLPWWIFGYLMPGLGFGVLKFAQNVAALDLPAWLFGT
jgi:hypothetical protein